MKSQDDIMNEIITELKSVVNENCIEKWLNTPNLSFDKKKPIELILNNNLEPIYQMIYRLKSGVPS